MHISDAWFLVRVDNLDLEHPEDTSIALIAVEYEHIQYGFPAIYAEKARIWVNDRELTIREALEYFNQKGEQHFVIRVSGVLAATGDDPRAIRLPDGRMVLAPWDFHIEAEDVYVEEDEKGTLELIEPDQVVERSRTKRPRGHSPN